MENPQPYPEPKTPPAPAIRFTERELELAHQMAALGIDWTPAPGMFLLDETGQMPFASPLQNRVFVILDLEYFLQIAGGMENLRRNWIWLPLWEEGRNWLRHHKMNDAEFFDRVRERIMDLGMTDREVLYELMVAILRDRR